MKKNEIEFDKVEDEKKDDENVKKEEDEEDENENEFVIKAPNNDTNEGRYIQCNQYPPLHVFRDENWGFILENRWVIFTSY